MGLIAVSLIALGTLLALVLPWIGVLTYYMFSVMQMQYLWPNEFGTIRIQMFIIAATLIGLIVATSLKQVDWRRIFTPFSLLMLLLVLIVNFSANYTSFVYYFDPASELGHLGIVSKERVLSIFNKTLFFYFVASLLIDTRKKLEISIYVLAGILLYYAAWANKVYLTGEFWLFGDNNRLGGPYYSLYQDENYLAMLFVMATPVLYYIGIARKNFFLRYAIWLTIPFTWHALFLTSSRGAMLSLAVVCIYVFFRSFNRANSIGLVLALVLAVVYQSGNLLTRVDSTIEASEQLEQLPEKKLDPRLISWGIATEIIRDFPLLGVGPGNFIKAYPNYSDTTASVAHNTFFQFAANCGLGAGLIYLWLFVSRLPTVVRSADINGSRDFPRGFSRDYLDDLLNSLFLAFFMVAIFLDLMIYEILYFIILLGFSKYNLDRAKVRKQRGLIDSIYRYSETKDTKEDKSSVGRS